MTTDPSVRPGAQGAITAIAVTLLVVGLAAVVFHFRQPKSAVDLSLTQWKPTERALAQYRAEQAALAALVTPGPEEQKVLAAFAELNRAEVDSVVNGPQESLRAAMTRMEIAAGRYFLDRGADAYRGLGVQTSRRFADILGKLLDISARKKTKVADIPTVFATDPTYLHWRDIGGDFLSNALRSGLVDSKGQLMADADVIIPLLFSSRWLYFVRTLRPVETLETPYARLTLLKWKVEYHHGLTMERRLELIREILDIEPTYPANDVLGRLYAKHLDWRRSAEHFEKALAEQPNHEILRANLEYVRSHLAR